MRGFSCGGGPRMRCGGGGGGGGWAAFFKG